MDQLGKAKDALLAFLVFDFTSQDLIVQHRFILSTKSPCLSANRTYTSF